MPCCDGKKALKKQKTGKRTQEDGERKDEEAKGRMKSASSLVGNLKGRSALLYSFVRRQCMTSSIWQMMERLDFEPNHEIPEVELGPRQADWLVFGKRYTCKDVPPRRGALMLRNKNIYVKPCP